jgi:hypothetical protein
MVFYREQDAGFSLDVGQDDEGHFDALVHMVEQALNVIATLLEAQRPAFLARLDAVRRASHTNKTLKKFAHVLADDLRMKLSVDWPQRESVLAKVRLMGQAHPAQVQVPAESAGCCGRTRAAAGDGARRGLGIASPACLAELGIVARRFAGIYVGGHCQQFRRQVHLGRLERPVLDRPT